MDKKGFELAIGTVVIMILAAMLLLFFVLFFTAGSSDFIGKIKSYFSYSNIDSVVKGCNILVDSDSEYSYCCEKKDVKYYNEGEKAEGEFSCLELFEKNIGDVNELDCGGVGC